MMVQSENPNSKMQFMKAMMKFDNYYYYMLGKLSKKMKNGNMTMWNQCKMDNQCGEPTACCAKVEVYLGNKEEESATRCLMKGAAKRGEKVKISDVHFYAKCMEDEEEKDGPMGILREVSNMFGGAQGQRINRLEGVMRNVTTSLRGIWDSPNVMKVRREGWRMFDSATTLSYGAGLALAVVSIMN